MKTQRFNICKTSLVILHVFAIALFAQPALAGSSARVGLAAIYAENADNLEVNVAVPKGKSLVNTLQNATLLLESHSAALMKGDVIMLGSSVLRTESSKQGYADDGVSCQFAVSFDDDNIPELSGICKFEVITESGKQISSKGIIPTSGLADDGEWSMIYEDTENNIAIYAIAHIE